MTVDNRRFPLKAALTKQNVVAFLHAIRLGEGTSGPGGYSVVVGGGVFMGFDEHPHRKVWIERYKVWSTAAGAYQIIWPTWSKLVEMYGFPDFSPGCQDEAAVALVMGRKALGDVEAGLLADAVQKCSAEWASLPGSQAGQRTEKYSDVKKEYVDHGGTLA